MIKGVVGEEYRALLEDLKKRVSASHCQAALSANGERILLYHPIGSGILTSQVNTLRDMTNPIGLAEYGLTESLLGRLRTALPTIEELEVELARNLKEERWIGSITSGSWLVSGAQRRSFQRDLYLLL